MSFICLHSHYLPGVDDGVRSLEEAIALCEGLKAAGFSKLVTTPHIHTVRFDNRRSNLEPAFEAFVEAVKDRDMPELGLAAEHWVDDVFFGLFQEGHALRYPGDHAILVELPRERLPVGLSKIFFRLGMAGARPILAHPERYRPFFRKSKDLEPLVEGGALPLLDIMSLTGKYGRRPRKAAERMLDEGFYFAACTDAHRPGDAEVVKEAIAVLRARVGDSETEQLLIEGPKRILSGRMP